MQGTVLSDIIAAIASQLRLRPPQVGATLDLLRSGLTVPFVAHYRKDATGGLNEDAILAVAEQCEQLVDLEVRKQAILRTIREQDQLTPELESAIATATHLRLVEELYLPLRPRKSTAAALAAQHGLEPLAQLIAEGRSTAPLDQLAANFVRHEHGVHTTEDALTGASHIVAEWLSNNPRLRQRVRDLLWTHGVLHCCQGIVPEDQVKEFRDYFHFSEALKSLPPHRILAVNRGERRKALKVTIEVPPGELGRQCDELVVPGEHRFAETLRGCLLDALQRLIVPTLTREVRHDLTEQAEKHAIGVFSSNLRHILMAPPVRGARVLALDPGFRTGCKVAALDAGGQLLGETIVYPHEPQNRRTEAKLAILEILKKHALNVIAIGNGTGCHETEKLVSEVIAEGRLPVKYSVVSEAGASIYAAGPLAKQEFANLEPAIRATVSVGRRLQDPLAEFVKVDPRSIGVGLYQHDVDQRLLKRRLDEVVYFCVNRVGADLNTAHAAVLERLSGLNPDLAAAIVSYRREHGPFRSREELKNVPGIDEQVFRLCAGFVRIMTGGRPFDRTRIHPESYAVTEQIIAELGYTENELNSPAGLPGLRKKLESLSLETLSQRLGAGIPTLSDILQCLEHPDRDPRDSSPPPIFKTDLLNLDDLQPGMWLKGTVRNVVDFGAFVDVGVSEDGLVHVSQISEKYIRNPVEVIHVNQIVDVRVVAIDRDRRRIALSMIHEQLPTPGLPPSGLPGPGAGRTPLQ